jgi:hypothetical protein
MHVLIAAVVEADKPADAIGWAEHDVTDRHGQLGQYFDYGTPMNRDEARFRGSLPEGVREDGAIRADTEDGQAILERLWESQLDELQRHLAVVETALESIDEPIELLDDPRVETEVEPYNPFGLASDPEDYADTVEHRVLYSMYTLGGNVNGSIRLYRQWDRPVKGPGDFEQLKQTIDEDGDDLWVVPLDVHY